jgi:hypothetical protein
MRQVSDPKTQTINWLLLTATCVLVGLWSSAPARAAENPFGIAKPTDGKFTLIDISGFRSGIHHWRNFNDGVMIGILSVLQDIADEQPHFAWLNEERRQAARTAVDRPIFAGRDGVKKYALAEIERERRTGTVWYGSWPETLLRPIEP